MAKKKNKISYSWLLGMLTVIAFTPQPAGLLLGGGCLIGLLLW